MNYKEVTIKNNYNNYPKDEIDTTDLYVSYEQIKSKERVNNHGEVLTPEWLVNDMLDLIPRSVSQIIESRYLENSAGEGVFLVEILRRKLNIVFRDFHEKSDREFYTLVSLCNIYGFELLKDNVEIIKMRLEMLIKDYFIKQYEITGSKSFFDTIRMILDINIINMDSIHIRVPIFNDSNQIMVDSDGKFIYSDESVCISEWEFDYQKKQVKRIEYYYEDVVNKQKEEYLLKQKEKELMQLSTKVNILGDVIEKKEERPLQISFFERAITENENESNIKNENVHKTILKPVRVFESVNYLKLGEAMRGK